MQTFIDDLGKFRNGANDAILESVADAFVICETADKKRADAIAYLESQCGGDRAAFIGKLATIVENASGDDKMYALSGLEAYVDTVFPAKS